MSLFLKYLHNEYNLRLTSGSGVLNLIWKQLSFSLRRYTFYENSEDEFYVFIIIIITYINSILMISFV